MSILTATTLAIILIGLVSHRYGIALALGGATSAGASLIVGATVVPTFYAVALGAAVILVVRVLAGRSVPEQQRLGQLPAVPFLIAFFAWAALVTLIAPLIFDGAPIVTTGVSHLVAGVITTSNLAQISYLALGIVVVVFLARSTERGPEILGLSLGVAMSLSLWRFLAVTWGVPFPEGVFDNSPNFSYIETAAGGVERFRGIFSEPSSLAGSALVALAYSISRMTHTSGWRRVGSVYLGATSLFLGAISTSTTFLIAGSIIGSVAVFVFAVGFLRRRVRVGPRTGIVGVLCAAVVVIALPVIVGWLLSSIGTKLGTDSFTQRSTSDADSIQVFVHSWGLGVGLGAGRASSILPTLLSTTGIIGVLLLTGGVATVIFGSRRLLVYRPVIWALSAWLVVKLVSGPDLSEPAGILWMGLGLLARGIVADREFSRAHFGSATDLRIGVPGVIR